LVGKGRGGEAAATHLVVDVDAFLPGGASLGTVVPARVYDSRPGPGITTVDGLGLGDGLLPAGRTTGLLFAGRAGLPATVRSVILTVTVTQPVGAGFITVWSCDAPRPTASNLNYLPGQTVANTVITKVAYGRSLCIYNYSATHLVVDVNGYE
jgi:hypothetical protein